MPIKYLSSDYAIYPEGISCTEPEHADSCDINKMIKNAARGLQVRGGSQPVYGYDDTTMDGVSFRIQKSELEKNLQTLAKENELSPDELKHVPNDVQKKFGFKTKKAEQKPVQKNDKPNDEKQDVTQASTKPDPSQKS